MSKSLPASYGPFAAPRGGFVRRVAAAFLRAASLLLARWARQMRGAISANTPQRAPELEFYAEAGAPEGALYADGEYVGRLHGVTRL